MHKGVSQNPNRVPLRSLEKRRRIKDHDIYLSGPVFEDSLDVSFSCSVAYMRLKTSPSCPISIPLFPEVALINLQYPINFLSLSTRCK